MSAPPTPGRAYGPCTACCRAIGVPELKKEVWRTCAHVAASGCGIYDDRPASCRSFACQWLRGVLEPDGSVDLGLRPDACGVIFDYQPGTAFGDVYTAWEIEPGATARDPARDVVEGLAERHSVMIIAPDPDQEDGSARRFVGPLGGRA